MAKLIDLTGQKIDKLLVLEKAPSRAKHVYWKCLCDCGNICEVSAEYLKRKNLPRDCGCSKQKNIKIQKKQEKENWLAGKKFGKLTVIKPLTERRNRSIVWECLCECGNIKNVPTHSLTNGHTQSCGCLIREVQSINITNQRFGKLTALYPCDYKKKSSLLWHCKCDCGKEIDADSYFLRKGLIKSCGCISQSIGAYKIEEILINNNINYIKEFCFDDLLSKNNRKLRFDFAILDNYNNVKRLIEFDGEQHFQDKTGIWEPLYDIQERDQQKNQYAKEHNIPLIRIPYWERENINLNMINGEQFLIK